jgi:hypothetical protein
MDGVTAHWAPDVIWDVSGYEIWPAERTVFVGAGDILAAFGKFLAGVRVLKMDVHEITALDDHHVMALYTERRQDGDGPEHDVEVGILYELGEGTVRRMNVITGHDRVRAAVPDFVAAGRVRG